MLSTAIQLEDALTPEIVEKELPRWRDRKVNKLPSGEEFFLKECTTVEAATREFLAYAVAEVIRAPVPAMYPLTDTKIVLSVVPGDLPNVAMEKVMKTEEGQRIALLHKLTGNTDAHEGNWRIVDGKPVSFDFNNAFAYHGGGGRFDARLDMSRFPPSARAEFHVGLQALESLFRFHNRGEWYTKMMKRWRELAPECHASKPPEPPVVEHVAKPQPAALAMAVSVPLYRAPRTTGLTHVAAPGHRDTVCGRRIVTGAWPPAANWTRVRQEFAGRRCIACARH